jgi:hypothetical protein
MAAAAAAAAVRGKGPAARNTLRDLLHIVPLGLVVGAGMELFMIKTGFYAVVTKNAGRDLDQQLAAQKARLPQRAERIAARQQEREAEAAVEAAAAAAAKSS